MFIRRQYNVHRVSSSLSGPVDPSFRALSGRLNFTVRRRKFNKDSFFSFLKAWRFTVLGVAVEVRLGGDGSLIPRKPLPAKFQVASLEVGVQS